jgi:hypothetical protein
VTAPFERRRVQRVKLLEPLAGKVAGQRVFILDISRRGVRVAHQESLGQPGQRCAIEFEWDGNYIVFDATLTHTRAQRVGTASYARSVYHSGFTIAAIAPRAEKALRAMIAWHVERALDEQKANARGIPAANIRSFQTGHGRDYVRHLYLGGAWRETHTTDEEQPTHGFTISANEAIEQVQMLRAAWESGDAAARAVIRKMAELSISRAEGIPTRRYTP